MRKTDFFDIINIVFMLLVLVLVGAPLLYIFSVSLSSNEQIAAGAVTVFPRGLNFSAYREILSTPKIPLAYWNSIFYTFLAVCISIVLLMLTAYPLSRKGLKGRKTILFLIAFTMMFNGGLIPFYLLIQSLHMMDTVWALVIPWAVPAYELMLLKNYFENVPNEVYEAATIDGASEYRIVFQIFVPMSLPILATLVMFIIRTQWNSYLIPLMYLSSPAKYPLQVVLQEMLMDGQAKSTSETLESAALNAEALKNATIVLSIIPILIVYPFVQKYFVRGMYAGAVKG